MFRSFFENKSEKRTLVLLLLVFFLIFLLIILVDAVNVQNPVSSKYSVWNKGWRLVNSSGESSLDTLPKTMVRGNGTATLSRVLDSRADHTNGVLRLCSMYEDVTVSLNGQTLYNYPNEQSALSDVTGVTYHYISLPEDAAGKELVIQYTFQGKHALFYQIKAPEFAEKETFLNRMVYASVPLTVVAVIAAIAGFAVLMMVLRVKDNDSLSNTFWNIGAFAILFAVFLFSRVPYASVFIHNPLGRHFLTYVTVLTMPIPFIRLFMGSSDERYRKGQIFAIILNFVNAAGQTALSLLRVADFRDLLPVTLLLAVFSMITVIRGIYKSEDTSKNTLWISDTAMLVGVGAFVDLTLAFFGYSSRNGCLFFTIGATLFLAAEIAHFMTAYSGNFRVNVETMLLQEMAYKDMLTGISNRNAYELYLTDITTRPPRDRMYGLIADINDLKYINDTYGHEMGDTIIVEVSKTLHKVFGKNSNCFRLGGDEFVAFIRGMSAEQMEQHIAEFKAELNAYNENHEPSIHVALGYAETEPDDYSNMKSFLHRIDKMMYEDKRFGKTLCQQYSHGKVPTDAEIEARVEASLVMVSVPNSLDTPPKGDDTSEIPLSPEET